MRLSEHHARKLLQLVERNRSKVKQGEYVDPDIWARHQPPLQGLIYSTRTAARSHLKSGHLGAQPVLSSPNSNPPAPLLASHSFNDCDSDLLQLDADASSRLFREIGPSISVAHDLASQQPSQPYQQPQQQHPTSPKQSSEFLPPVTTLETPPGPSTQPDPVTSPSSASSTGKTPAEPQDHPAHVASAPPLPPLPPPPPPPLPVATSVYRGGVRSPNGGVVLPPPPTPPPPEAFVHVDEEVVDVVGGGSGVRLEHEEEEEEEELESYEEFPDSLDGDSAAAREARVLDFGRGHAPREHDGHAGRRDSTLSSGYLSRSEYTGYSEDVEGEEGDLQEGTFGKVESLPDSLSDPFMGKEGVSVVGTEG